MSNAMKNPNFGSAFGAFHVDGLQIHGQLLRTVQTTRRLIAAFRTLMSVVLS
jgi:hypothetical protein